MFEGAQKELRNVFGMQMEELPIKERVTIAQRRGWDHVLESILVLNCHV